MWISWLSSLKPVSHLLLLVVLLSYELCLINLILLNLWSLPVFWNVIIRLSRKSYSCELITKMGFSAFKSLKTALPQAVIFVEIAILTWSFDLLPLLSFSQCFFLFLRCLRWMEKMGRRIVWWEREFLSCLILKGH